MADLPITSDKGGQPVVINDPVTTANVANVTAAGALKVDGSAVTQPVSGTVTGNQGSPNTAANKWPVEIVDSGGVNVATVNATNELLVTDTDLTLAQGSTTSGQLGPIVQGAVTTSSPTYVTGQTDPLSLDTSGRLRIDNSSWIGSTAPTVGQKTSANSVPVVIASDQSTIAVTPAANSSVNLSQVGGNTVVTGGSTGLLAIAGPVASGSANADNPVKIAAVFNTTQPTVTNGQIVDAQATARGAQIVATGTDTFNVTVNAALPTGTNTIGNVGVTQGSTTSGESGELVQGAVTTSAPTYVTGQTNPLSLTTVGNLRVDGSSVTQPVSGTVTANQGTAAALAGAWPTKITDGTNSLLVQASLGTVGVIDLPKLLALGVSGVTSLVTPYFGFVVTASTSNVLITETANTEQASNAQRSVNSTSANDTSAGTGARTVIITYYSQTGNGALTGPFTETVTLNGTTAVNTVSTTIRYIESIVVLTVGSTTTNAGTIQLWSATGATGSVIASIAVNLSRTYTARHYIASGRKFYLLDVHGSNNLAGQAKVFIQSTDLSSANAITTPIIPFIFVLGASNTVQWNVQTPVVVTGPAKIEGWVTPSSASSQTTDVNISGYEF